MSKEFNNYINTQNSNNFEFNRELGYEIQNLKKTIDEINKKYIKTLNENNYLKETILKLKNNNIKNSYNDNYNYNDENNNNEKLRNSNRKYEKKLNNEINNLRDEVKKLKNEFSSNNNNNNNNNLLSSLNYNPLLASQLTFQDKNILLNSNENNKNNNYINNDNNNNDNNNINNNNDNNNINRETLNQILNKNRGISPELLKKLINQRNPRAILNELEREQNLINNQINNEFKNLLNNPVYISDYKEMEKYKKIFIMIIILMKIKN